MVKKEFTKDVQKRLNNLSDIELIEELDGTAYGSGEVYREIIRAILDKRLKKSIQDLTENVKKGNKTTEDLTENVKQGSETSKRYNAWLIGLTIVIAALTLFMLAGLGIQIWLNLK